MNIQIVITSMPAEQGRAGLDVDISVSEDTMSMSTDIEITEKILDIMAHTLGSAIRHAEGKGYLNSGTATRKAIDILNKIFMDPGINISLPK
jgi:N-methylhydantoinase B/oxoprolinase/acetone carboxylase alpha subunit